MLVSIRWLSRHVDLADLDPAQIAEDLTRHTAEVEGLVAHGEGLGDIVVGKVVERGPHPNADKLSLCQVDGGDGELLPIVCGAPNVAQGQFIALAKLGVRLPDGTKIKKAKIRGETSCGMICSERELGFSDEHEGILVLDEGARPGTPLGEVLPILDSLLEIDNKSVTHRPDLWGHYGFARELAAIYDRELRPALAGREPEIPAEGETLPIELAPSRGRCARYAGLVFDDVQIGPAPSWMRFLLLAIGQRPLNAVVDLTNFLMHDLGQPMHAFDLDRLRGPSISVRFASSGETMRTLDGEERVLADQDLLICDAGGPVALAGIMGGEGSMVGPTTTRVFLESASFDAATIRRSSTRLGLRSESSARFEKSLDPLLAETCTRAFAAYLPEVAPGARAVGPIVEPSGWRFGGREIPLRILRANRVLGVRLSEGQIRGYLEPLGFHLAPTTPGFMVSVPSWRATKDIEREEDLIEELGRRHGYENIPPRAPLRPVEPVRRDPELAALRVARTCLAGDCGYAEAYNYSFLPDELVEQLGLGDESYLRVTNAIASNLTRMRRAVLPSLLGSLAGNLRRAPQVALFEVGKGCRPEQEGEGGLPFEVHEVAALYADRGPGAPAPYARVRGHLELCLERLSRPELGIRAFDAGDGALRPWMHPRQSAVFHDPADPMRVAAYVGALHPRMLQGLEVDDLQGGGGVAALCIDLRVLLSLPEQDLRYTARPKFPEQPVDLAFLVAESLSVAELAELCGKANPKLVRKVELFEVFRGKPLQEGKKSLNFRVTLGSDQRTLESADEERYIERVRKAAKDLGAELRG